MASVNAYSILDQLAHRVAFSSRRVQLLAAEIEDSLYCSNFQNFEIGPPIFVTSLPRAGTTVLLTALNSVPELATHLYRDMPFIMAPVLWSRLIGGYRQEAATRERAHRDGIEIGYDSPEAFEEVIWQAFWPEHFKPDGISLWSPEDADAEAKAFMHRHFQKIVYLRLGENTAAGRYISKNNANIARLDLIPHLFPGAQIIVPVREPVAHAASLKRQHENFRNLHAEDQFTRRYMADIGHFEFGALHRPIQFELFESLSTGLTPGDLDYWLAYWVAAFEHIGQHRESAHLVNYERVCEGGEMAGGLLCELLGLDPSNAGAIGAHFRAPPGRQHLNSHRSELRDRAEALYHNLVGS